MGSGVLWSADPDGGQHQAAVIQGILAGGKADDLIAVDGSDARIVEGQLFDGGNEIIDIRLVHRIHHLVVGKAFAGCFYKTVVHSLSVTGMLVFVAHFFHSPIKNYFSSHNHTKAAPPCFRMILLKLIIRQNQSNS